jgi:hypothetical protein
LMLRIILLAFCLSLYFTTPSGDCIEFGDISCRFGTFIGSLFGLVDGSLRFLPF